MEHSRPPSERVYRLLLALTRVARDGAAEDEMTAAFRDELGERRKRGPGAVLALWPLLIADLAIVVWRDLIERTHAARSAGRARDSRAARGRPGMEHWLSDLRTGLRTLRRSPSYTLTAVLILGLAMGANATIFSLVDVLFLARPPHVAAPERLVRVHRSSQMSETSSLAYPDYAFYRDQSRTLSGLAAYDPDGVTLSGEAGGAREALHGWLVSENYFDVLGVLPAAGRWFLPDEDVVDAAARVVVVSHRTWTTLLGGGPDAVGSTLTLNGHPFTVVGVAPAGFRGVSPIEGQPDLWVPLTNQPLLTPLSGEYALKRVPDSLWIWLWGIGRLAPEATVEQAREELSRLGGQLAEEYPEWNEGSSAAVTEGVGLHPRQRGGLLTVAQVLAGVVAVVLLIAVANVAILLLARATVRRREAGVRLAIGASRSRLARLMLAESLLVSIAGGVVGLGLAHATSRLAASLLPVTLAVDVRPSVGVMAFAFFVSSVAAVLFTALPALRASGVGPTAMLQRERDAGSWRAQGALVSLQVALSVTLVVSGGLLVRSLGNARAVDLGFETEGRTLISVNLRNHGYGDDQAWAFAREAIERLAAVPGVEAASATVMVPFRGGWTGSVLPEGHPRDEGSEVDSGFNAVAPGYFEALGIPIVAGRAFAASDDAGAPLVVVVNEEFADRYFPGETAVGKRLYGDPGEPDRMVVGVARNARYYELDEDPHPMVYLSIYQRSTPGLRLLVDSTLGLGALERPLREAIESVDSEVAQSTPVTLEQVVGEELGRYRTAATLVGLFAGLALLLACVGLYGALSYLVVQRTREIGIRVAIGARPREVARAILLRGLAVTGVGLLTGLLAAMWATRWLESLLFGLEALDPVTFAAVPVLLLGVAVLASLGPARRAMRVDPIEAMRVD